MRGGLLSKVTTRQAFAPSVVVLLAGLFACDTGRSEVPPAASVQVDTIDGVEQLSYSGEVGWRAGTPWRVDSSRIVEIGRLEGEAAYLFGQIAGVVVGADGRIHVADGQANEVRTFSPEGTFLSRLGRAGEGPGEFRNIGGLGRGPDSEIAVVDGMLGRVSLFDAEGQFQRSFRLERPYRMIRHEEVHFDGLGRYYDRVPLSTTAALVDSTGVMRYGPEGSLEETVLLWAHEPRRLTIVEGGRPMASMSIPFSPHPSAAIDSRGRAYVTAGDAYRIAVLDPSGDTLRILVRGTPPIPLGDAIRDSARDALAERYRQIAGAEARDLPEIPQQMPAIVALRVDEADHLWVQRPSGDPATMLWDVFAPDGAFLGELRFPAMRVMHLGERIVAGAVLDEMDVPRVRVLPIIRE